MKNTLLLLAGLCATSAWAQNDCATALPVLPGFVVVPAIDGVIPLPDCTTSGAGATNGEWYSYTPTQDTMLTVTTDLVINTGGDTRFQVYTGVCGALTCVAGDDDSGVIGTGFLSTATFEVTGGVTYIIAFDDRWRDTGFTFELIESAPPSPGGECASAMAVGMGLHSVGALTGLMPPMNCIGGISMPAHGLWYSFVPTQDTTLIITTELPQNTGRDTRFLVYSGTCGGLVCAGGGDNNNNGLLASDTVLADQGAMYFIVFDDTWDTAHFDFLLAGMPPPVVPVTFTHAGTVPAYAMGAVDMNGDHRDDIVAPNNASVVVMHQQPDGSLVATTIPTPVPDHTPSWSFCAGDINKDGYTDMMYGGGQGATFMMATNEGNGFTEVSFPQYIFCQRTNMVDLDNDGDLDAFSCHDVDANVWFSNDGAGNLTFNQGGLGPNCGNYGSLWTDYDDDGDQDLFIAKCGCDPVDLFMRNDGDMNFVSIAAQNNFADMQQSWSSAWGDFDNDGDMDALVGSSAGADHKLMRNDGTTFTNVTTGSGFDAFTGSSIEWVTHDFDNDGWLDVLGGGGFMHNNGDMTFSRVNNVPTNGPVGDVNGDGFLDIISFNQIYLNDGNANHWLTVAPVGTTSNSNGIGARIEITSAMGTQIRDIRSGDGFEYMSTLNAHFGLGADELITNLTIRWPSGLVTSLDDVPVDTMLVVVEGVTTGVPEHDNATVELYPSPAEHTLFIRNGDQLGNRAVTVFDAAGKVALRTTLRNGTVDVSGLTNGLYLLRIAGAEQLQARFLKQ